MSYNEKMYKYITLSEKGSVVVVKLNRPEEKNSLNTALIRELTDVALSLRERTDVHVVILTGSDDYFSAGVDLKEAATRSGDIPSLLQLRHAVSRGPAMCEAWERLEQVTIAAIEGHCIGGAAVLALSCDFRVMGEGAFLRLPETQLGLNMSWGAIPRLVSLIGPSKTKRFVILGKELIASDALRWGAADEIVDRRQALHESFKIAQEISSLPPVSVRMTKATVNAVVNANHQAVSHMDRDQFLLMFAAEDHKEAVRAFFEKRQPTFTGG